MSRARFTLMRRQLSSSTSRTLAARSWTEARVPACLTLPRLDLVSALAAATPRMPLHCSSSLRASSISSGVGSLPVNFRYIARTTANRPSGSGGILARSSVGLFGLFMR